MTHSQRINMTQHVWSGAWVWTELGYHGAYRATRRQPPRVPRPPLAPRRGSNPRHTRRPCDRPSLCSQVPAPLKWARVAQRSMRRLYLSTLLCHAALRKDGQIRHNIAPTLCRTASTSSIGSSRQIRNLKLLYPPRRLSSRRSAACCSGVTWATRTRWVYTTLLNRGMVC
eukprot:SAG11_NODE_8508_length_1008_cov_0.930693_2_plen_169_part_01